VAERSEAGWGSAERVIDERQDAVQIAIDFIVPESQHPEALVGKVIVALRIAASMRIEIMLTAIDLDQESMPETDEVYDIAVAWGLTAEVESAFSP
jgi:hypothetical protein